MSATAWPSATEQQRPLPLESWSNHGLRDEPAYSPPRSRAHTLPIESAVMTPRPNRRAVNFISLATMSYRKPTYMGVAKAQNANSIEWTSDVKRGRGSFSAGLGLVLSGRRKHRSSPQYLIRQDPTLIRACLFDLPVTPFRGSTWCLLYRNQRWLWGILTVVEREHHLSLFFAVFTPTKTPRWHFSPTPRKRPTRKGLA